MTNIKQNSVRDIQDKNSVRDIRAQNPVRPMSRPSARHPIYNRARPPQSNAALVILALVFWPISLVFLIGAKTLETTRKG